MQRLLPIMTAPLMDVRMCATFQAHVYCTPQLSTQVYYYSFLLLLSCFITTSSALVFLMRNDIFKKNMVYSMSVGSMLQVVLMDMILGVQPQ